MTISDAEWVPGSSSVTWQLDTGVEISKLYKMPIGSFLILKDRSGAAVVEAVEEKGKQNAVIFNEDGSERCRVELPLPEDEIVCFYYMHYERDNLVAVIVTRSVDVAATVDPQSGRCSNLHETR